MVKPEMEDNISALTPNEILLSMFNLGPTGPNVSSGIGIKKEEVQDDEEYSMARTGHFNSHDNNNSNKDPHITEALRSIPSSNFAPPKFNNFMLPSDNKMQAGSISVQHRGSSLNPLHSQPVKSSCASFPQCHQAPPQSHSIIGIRKRPRSDLPPVGSIHEGPLTKINPVLAGALSTPTSAAWWNVNDLGSNNTSKAQQGVEMQLFRENNNLSPLTLDSLGRPSRVAGPVTLETPVITTTTSEDSGLSTTAASHLVSFNGLTTEVPDEIRCHLCNFPMKICFRKSKYKSEIREYPAYRCLRKGCQTFRAIRKVIEPQAPASSKAITQRNYRKNKLEREIQTLNSLNSVGAYDLDLSIPETHADDQFSPNTSVDVVVDHQLDWLPPATAPWLKHVKTEVASIATEYSEQSHFGEWLGFDGGPNMEDPAPLTHNDLMMSAALSNTFPLYSNANTIFSESQPILQNNFESDHLTFP